MTKEECKQIIEKIKDEGLEGFLRNSIKDEEGKNLLAALFTVVADPLSDEDYEAMELQVLEAFADYADPEPEEETVREMPWDYGKHFDD